MSFLFLNTLTDLSSEAVSRNCPPPLPPSPDGDGENATDLTAAVCPLKSDDSPLAELTHTRTDLSREAEAISRPEGEKAWGDEEIRGNSVIWYMHKMIRFLYVINAKY